MLKQVQHDEGKETGILSLIAAPGTPEAAKPIRQYAAVH
jgi:hypothetical protein